MKKKILTLAILIFSLFITGCEDKKSDGEKFAEEYTQVSKYNLFTYKNSDEIIKILENGTGVVYLGFPECPWCQAYVPILNEVADLEGMNKISYYNILNDRKDNTKTYQKIVSLLNEYLQYDEDGNKRIYVPSVIIVEKGKIIGFNDETSYDTLGYDTPDEYWTDERKSNLKKTLSEMISKIVDNSCTDCNS